MSDAAQGPGWWMASDGRWYPPHLHPSLPPPPPGAGSTRTGTSTTPVEAHPGGAPPPQGAPLSAPPPGASYPPGYGPPPYWPPPNPAHQAPPYWPPPTPIPPGAPGGYWAAPTYWPAPVGTMPGGWARPPYGGPVDPIVGQPLAPWWKRLVAILLDGLLAGITLFIVLAIIGAVIGRNTNASSPNNNHASAGVVAVAFVLLYLLASLPLALYFGFTNGSRRGQTIGKMAMGIAVRDARTGGPVGFWRAFGRYWITVVFSVVIYLPYLIDSLSPLWDSRRQSWHDKVTHTVVIDLKP